MVPLFLLNGAFVFINGAFVFVNGAYILVYGTSIFVYGASVFRYVASKLVNGASYFVKLVPLSELSSLTQTNSILRSHAETIISHSFEIPCSFSEVPL